MRRAASGDEAVVRGVRLEALADAPDDFDSTREVEIAWTTSNWQRWLSRGATFLLERDDDVAKGLAAGVPHRDDRSIVFLGSMWVHPELRGTGGADALVAAVVAWAEEEGAAEVWLHVDKRNDRARRFYERNGFRATGEVARARDGLVEIEMRLTRGGTAGARGRAPRS